MFAVSALVTKLVGTSAVDAVGDVSNVEGVLCLVAQVSLCVCYSSGRCRNNFGGKCLQTSYGVGLILAYVYENNAASQGVVVHRVACGPRPRCCAVVYTQ